jgi:glyoxylase-like metal-dependent hydrolase (beta-lactamase superfamily II)
MHALAVHKDVIVVISGVWQTSCTAVRAGGEGFLIDSPVMIEELEALPSLLQQTDFPVSGLLATHGDWDHLLGRLAFPEAALGVGESTAERLNAALGETQRQLRDFDERFYVAHRPPLQLGALQGLPVPGRISLGGSDEAEIEVHPAPGHTADGIALHLPWASVLICGDYLSPIELPRWDAPGAGGSPVTYLETLKRLEPLVAAVDTVVPGHGEPLLGSRAERALTEDLEYVQAIVDGHEPELPAKRRDAEQRRIHAANMAALDR